MLHMYTENMTDSDKAVVQNSKSYPLIRELVHAFGWRVVGFAKDRNSIEAGQQTFLMVDKLFMPVGEAYVVGSYDCLKQDYEDVQYCVTSNLISSRGHGRDCRTYKSKKIPYLIKNIKSKTVAKDEPENYFYTTLKTSVSHYHDGARSSIGKVDIGFHSLNLTTDDVYMLLRSKLSGGILEDENKYKVALDLLESCKDNKRALEEKMQENLANPFYYIHTFAEANGVYLSKVVCKESYKDYEIVEPPVYYSDLSELENELPVLTMMKVLNESEADIRSVNGIPRLDRYYPELEISTYYDWHSQMPSTVRMVIPCPSV